MPSAQSNASRASLPSSAHSHAGSVDNRASQQFQHGLASRGNPMARSSEAPLAPAAAAERGPPVRDAVRGPFSWDPYKSPDASALQPPERLHPAAADSARDAGALQSSWDGPLYKGVPSKQVTHV